jgi:pyruvate/2-oxoglutarate dehydrogenase complex dihydrolipoamide acyltransferase (E2) component
MIDISLNEELWQNSMLPEGILERWFVDDGTPVTAGERIAEVRIESALHEIMSPGKGVLTILAEKNAVVEPGSRVARLVV